MLIRRSVSGVYLTRNETQCFTEKFEETGGKNLNLRKIQEIDQLNYQENHKLVYHQM